MSHSPGSLRVAITFIENEKPVFGVYTQRTTDRFNGELVATFDDEDDANFFAAAPDLLEALEECITQEGSVARKDVDHVKLIRRLNAIDEICRAAIAKATGA